MGLEGGDPRGFMVWKSGSWEMGVDGWGHAETDSMEGKIEEEEDEMMKSSLSLKSAGYKRV